jgi:hypothetical protein
MRTGLGFKAAVAGNTPQVEQFFDRLITLPSPTDQAAYATFINALVSDGTFAAHDALCVLGAPDAGSSFTELTSGKFTPILDVVTGIPTFTAYRGWTGFAAPTQCDINSNFNPSTAGGHYTQNAASVGGWNLQTVQNNSTLWRDQSDTDIECWPLYSDAHTYTQINDGTEIGTVAGIPDGSGWFSISRTASNLYTVKRNNALLASPTTTSRALVNSNIYFGGAGQILAAYSIGALSPSQETTLYNALFALLHGWGAV